MLLVDGVAKEYRKNSKVVRALDRVSFKVENGEVVGIIGTSGGGKSTLLRILAGIEPFDEGMIDLDGRMITPFSSEDEFKWLQLATGIYLQRSFSIESESALENVMRRLYANRYGYEALPPKHSKEYSELSKEAERYLEMVGLSHKKNHIALLLSSGEKQRLILARLLAKRPRLLLLDEPATMACPRTKQEVLDTILSVRKELDIPILIVSHLPEVVNYVADRVLWLENGRIREKGKPKDVIDMFLRMMPEPTPPTSPKTDEKKLIATNLTKRYSLITGETFALNDLSVEITTGEILGVVGNSGGGKTTFVEMLAGVLQPDGGSVKFNLDGRWVELSTYSRERMEARRRIGIMYQEFTLSPHATLLSQISQRLGIKGDVERVRQRAREMGISDVLLDRLYLIADMKPEHAGEMLRELEPDITATDIIAKLFPSIPEEEARRIAEPVFKALGLDPRLMDTTGDQLSVGEGVRAMLAIVLSSHPELLILDEPFGDIDPITLMDVANHLKNVNREFGTSIVIVSHHMHFMKEVAHRVMWIENGQIKAIGNPDEVCRTFVKNSGAKYLETFEV